MVIAPSGEAVVYVLANASGYASIRPRGGMSVSVKLGAKMLITRYVMAILVAAQCRIRKNSL